MMVSLEMQIQKEQLTDQLRKFSASGLARFRRRLVKQTLLNIVDQVITRHPVDTGRSRDAWIDAANQLRGGSVAAESEGHAMQREEKDQTTMEVTNEVNYIAFLEKGTRNTQGRQMVSRSLAEAPAELQQITGPLLREEWLGS